MPGTKLLRLQRPTNIFVPKSSTYLVTAMAENDTNIIRADRMRAIDYVL